MVTIWTVFELVGTVAFAISGALVGAKKRMDIFGVSVLALATAIGGGIIRDLLVGHTPPNSFRSPLYVGLTLAVVVIIFLLGLRRVNFIEKKGLSRQIFVISDTLGLASFTVTGAMIGANAQPDNILLATSLGLITAIGGGIIRDVLAKEIPSVLREDVYALPAIVGAFLCALLLKNGFDSGDVYISFVVSFCLRLLAFYRGWSLPRLQ